MKKRESRKGTQGTFALFWWGEISGEEPSWEVGEYMCR